MCYVWRYRLAFSVFAVLVLIICDVHSVENAALAGKLYSRGNHWAVGHLMGKKSTDEQVESEVSDREGEQYMDPPPNKKVDKNLRSSYLLQAVFRALVGLENESASEDLQPRQSSVEKRGHWLKEKDEERAIQEVTEVLLKTLDMKEDDFS